MDDAVLSTPTTTRSGNRWLRLSGSCLMITTGQRARAATLPNREDASKPRRAPAYGAWLPRTSSCAPEPELMTEATVGPDSTWAEISRSGTTEAARLTATCTTSRAAMAPPETSASGTRLNGSTIQWGWLTCTTWSAHPRAAASAAAHSTACPPALLPIATTTRPACPVLCTESPTVRGRRCRRPGSRDSLERFPEHDGNHHHSASASRLR